MNKLNIDTKERRRVHFFLIITLFKGAIRAFERFGLKKNRKT